MPGARLPILMYHSVSPRQAPGFARWTVAPEVFSQQTAYLAQAGYRALTMSQVAAALTRRELPAKAVALTFDDAFVDFATAALPILSRHGFAATLYVTTSCVGSSTRWLPGGDVEPGLRLLDWAGLAEVIAGGTECGGHSHTHPKMDTLRPEEVRREVVTNRRLLEDKLGCAVPSFAYPFGFSSAGVRQEVRRAGYTGACGVDFAPAAVGDDTFDLPRILAPTDFSPQGFAALLAGPGAAYVAYRRVRARLWHLARSRVGRVRRGWWQGLWAA